jgi:Caspase domain/Putative peptidoglycan binding domain
MRFIRRRFRHIVVGIVARGAGVAALALLLAGAESATGAPAPGDPFGKRVALVIGNGAYKEMGNLPNPPNDARAVASALESLNFQVTSVIDGDVHDLQSALRLFGRSAVNADIALFYYAGHGMAFQGENYLLPIGAQIAVEPDLAYEALSLGEVRRQLEFTDASLKMVILDACRDNPLGQTLKRNAAELGRSVDAGEGLARVEVAPASGMLIAYATAPGNLALDGDDKANSPFTSALLDNIATPNIDVRVMFGRVRSEVVAATKSYQTPWVEDGMLGEFQFNPAPVAPAPAPEPPSDLTAWRDITDSQDPADFEAFLKDHPDSMLTSAARDRLALLSDPQAELAAWNALHDSSDIQAYEVFLRRYPSGPYTAAASVTLQNLLWTQLSAASDADGMKAFVDRFPTGPFATLARITIDSLQHEAEQAPAPLTIATAEPPPEEAHAEVQRALTLVEPPAVQDDVAKAAALTRTSEIEPNLIQIALKALGHYGGRIDGVFGPASRRAVAAYQEQLGQAATGVLTPEQVVELIAAAADAGDSDSQNTYGIMFASGQGVLKDPAAAAKWFRLSADAGNEYAHENLGLLEAALGEEAH